MYKQAVFLIHESVVWSYNKCINQPYKMLFPLHCFLYISLNPLPPYLYFMLPGCSIIQLKRPLWEMLSLLDEDKVHLMGQHCLFARLRLNYIRAHKIL